jgi:hypothetical protein
MPTSNIPIEHTTHLRPQTTDQATPCIMLSTLWRTLRYTFAVRGHYSTPSASFPIRMGCKQSDMFRLGVTESESADGVTLRDFHAAFLSSPLFRTELWILSKIGAAHPEMTSHEHLLDVASGEKSSFGPWTSWAVNGSREKAVTAQSDPASACVVMRCYVSQKPFCDTWWAVEKTLDNKLPELVFGTAMKLPKSEKGWSITSLQLTVLDPVHRLYSRILLASAKATLLDQQRRKRAANEKAE